MFLRFTVPRRDTQSGAPAGIFVVTYQLLDGDTLPADERDAIRGTLDWFRENLRVPPCLKADECPAAICWFRSSAVDHVRHAWHLIRLLRARDTLVRLHKSTNPGRLVYQDDHQVVATPWRGTPATIHKAWA